ncbi:MAG: hypothetical protein PHQ23_05210 [Candidatus Wallbacteria bacterium]|nr:hypothetical protein [Candidatus Wallbacteria bacterium]
MNSVWLFLTGLAAGVLGVAVCAMLRGKNRGNSTLCEMQGWEDILDMQLRFQELHEEFQKNSRQSIESIENRIQELKDLLRISDEKILYLNSLSEELEGKFNKFERRTQERSNGGPVSDSGQKPVLPVRQHVIIDKLSMADRAGRKGYFAFADEGMKKIDITVSDQEPLQ